MVRSEVAADLNGRARSLGPRISSQTAAKCFIYMPNKNLRVNQRVLRTVSIPKAAAILAEVVNSLDLEPFELTMKSFCRFKHSSTS